MPKALVDLQPYRLAVHFCSKVLHSPPDAALLEAIHTDQLFAVWPLAVHSAAAQQALFMLEEANRTAPMDALAVHLDHVRLFSGPQPLARPWESVWREKEQLLFGENTVQVRDTYAAWGLEVEGRGHCPEDSLAFELAFVAHLLQMASVEGQCADCIERQCADCIERQCAALAALVDFLDKHLLPWAEPCLHEAAMQAGHVFYAGVSELCLDALTGLRRSL